MDSSNKDTSNNWLKEAVGNRSEEINKKTMMGVFHRMRVVERLILTEYQRGDEDIDKAKLLPIAKKITTEENDARQKNIIDFNLKTDLLRPVWYEPYDISDEVINDGVIWYQDLKQNISRKDFLITKYFEEFIKDIYKYSNDKNFYSETELKSHHNFSDVVLSLVTNKIYEIKPVANHSNETTNKALERLVEKGSKSENVFIRGITSISNRFDDLYQKVNLDTN